MKVSQRMGLLLFLFTQLALCGFARVGIITTPFVDGAQVIAQFIDHPSLIRGSCRGFWRFLFF
jgi:hypothetical protein